MPFSKPYKHGSLRTIVGLAICALATSMCAEFALADGLLKDRAGFETTLTVEEKDDAELEEISVDHISLVKYPTALGAMNAHIASAPLATETKAGPAIIWITGGFPPGGAGSWIIEDKPVSNDQSAKSYWQSGVLTMYPTFRGASGNPGFQEGFFGEVDDVLAAYDFLIKDERVDPERVYLGGHSTGGTLALLAAAASDKFAAVFALGPVADPADYGASSQLHDSSIPGEDFLRAPIKFLSKIRVPTFIIEGSEGNISSLQELKAASSNDKLVYVDIQGATHFSYIAAANNLIASNLASDEDISKLTKNRFQAVFSE